jgi:FixJ family two-component response regulator
VTTSQPIILLVDDDLSVRRGLTRLLKAVGYQVAAFGCASELLASGLIDRASCLVLDVRMPGMNGLDLHRNLVADGREVPAVFMTGHGDIAMAVRAMKQGAVDFLAKPFEDQEMLDAVRQAVARWQRVAGLSETS